MMSVPKLLAAVMVCGVLTAGCGDPDPDMTAVTDAVQGVPFEIELRDVEPPPDTNGVVFGEATHEASGTSLRFAFVGGWNRGNEVRRYMGPTEDIGFNHETGILSIFGELKGASREETSRMSRMLVELDNAVCVELTGRNCPI